VRVVFSDESGTGKNSVREPITLVAAILLDMDSQWVPVRDAIEEAIKNIYEKGDDQLERYALKAKALYHQIERGDIRAAEMMNRLMAIPREQGIPIWYGAVDRAGFKMGMERMRLPASPPFKENNIPFKFAFEECMHRIDTWMHADGPEEHVLWIHDDGSLNERAKQALRGFRWAKNIIGLELAHRFPEGLALLPEAQPSRIADMIYFGDDKESRMLQLVDACAATIVRALRYDPVALPYYGILRTQVQNDGARPAFEATN